MRQEKKEKFTSPASSQQTAAAGSAVTASMTMCCLTSIVDATIASDHTTITSRSHSGSMGAASAANAKRNDTEQCTLGAQLRKRWFALYTVPMTKPVSPFFGGTGRSNVVG